MNVTKQPMDNVTHKSQYSLLQYVPLTIVSEAHRNTASILDMLSESNTKQNMWNVKKKFQTVNKTVLLQMFNCS